MTVRVLSEQLWSSTQTTNIQLTSVLVVCADSERSFAINDSKEMRSYCYYKFNGWQIIYALANWLLVSYWYSCLIWNMSDVSHDRPLTPTGLMSHRLKVIFWFSDFWLQNGLVLVPFFLLILSIHYAFCIIYCVKNSSIQCFHSVDLPAAQVSVHFCILFWYWGWWNLREWTKRHGQKWECGKCRSGHIGTIWQGWTLREWTMRHHMAGVDFAGVDNAAPLWQGWTMQEDKTFPSKLYWNCVVLYRDFVHPRKIEITKQTEMSKY